jgi:hypothetical protein
MTSMMSERDLTGRLAQLFQEAMKTTDPVSQAQANHRLAKYAEARHKLGPLLWSLVKQGRLNVDDEAAAYLRSTYRHVGLFIAKQQSTRAKLKQIFAAALIPYIEFKGRGLAEQLFEDPAARFSKDIDIIVGKKDRNKALDALHAAGFLRAPNGPEMSRRNSRIWMWLRKDASLFDPQTGQQVELHQRLFSCETEGLSEAFVAANLTDVIPRINNEHYIFYLLLHGAHSHWPSLRRVLDVPLLFKKASSADPIVVFELAHRYQCASAISASIRFAESVFPGDVDKTWMALANKYLTPKSTALEASFKRLLFSPLGSVARARAPLSECYTYDDGISYLREAPKRLMTFALNRIEGA